MQKNKNWHIRIPFALLCFSIVFVSGWLKVVIAAVALIIFFIGQKRGWFW